MATRKDFLSALGTGTLSFPDNLAARRIVAGTLGLPEYHRLLSSLYHVAHTVPLSTRLAADRCREDSGASPNCTIIAETLQAHAERVSSHADLLLKDLLSSGYGGPDPRTAIPAPATEAYIAFNFYIAATFPVARLAIIAVMDAISSSFSGNYSAKILQGLGLKPSQISFFFRQEDASNRLEPITDVLERISLSETEWRWMTHAAATSARLYRDLYDAAAAVE